jgi:hypothetical protein
MKTVEEKTIAFVRELQEALINSNHSGFYILPELLGVAHHSFMVGYNEAMRWRDPKEELPEFNKNDYPNGDYKRYLIKVVRGSISTRSYVAVGWLISANRWNVEMDWVNVIGWRPIE